ncbi:uncharacterized protein F4807DRAFT_457435 [Annulohypoxylon truncatum]|uniref:uncharacterized protein n=1 Tax=Annulohypoxylon truncatum TaxID=327061 RepID=UPI002007A333|nr:uncharacterized protein F4807DRAFT_457435 [Annulohypoxylon truncatum]KAI1212639.1 hypothetical protein F4807DRAFT_457435 [Annulohypoxylon truncatum]
MEDSNSPSFICTACIERVHRARQLPCGCYYCADCLYAFFAVNVDLGLRWPPQCCEIDSTEDDAAWLDEGMLFAFQELYREAERGVEHRLYCSRPQCSAPLSDEKVEEESGVVTCEKCGTATCKKCKQPAHGTSNAECKEPSLDPELKELAAENRWQQCPNCRRMVSRSDGCPRIRCVCGMRFCYVCGQAWKTCNCTEWEEDLRDLADDEFIERLGLNVEGDGGRDAQEILSAMQENLPPARPPRQRRDAILPPDWNPRQEREDTPAQVDQLPLRPLNYRYGHNYENPLREERHSSTETATSPLISNPLSAYGIEILTDSGDDNTEGPRLWTPSGQHPTEGPSLLHSPMGDMRATATTENPSLPRGTRTSWLSAPPISEEDRARLSGDRDRMRAQAEERHHRLQERSSRIATLTMRDSAATSETQGSQRSPESFPGHPLPEDPLPEDPPSNSSSQHTPKQPRPPR